MSILERRRFLRSAAAIATVGSVSGATRYRWGEQVATENRWEWADSGRTFSTFNDVRCVDGGFLLVGTVRDDTDPSEGWAVTLTESGDVSWSRRYASSDQHEALEEDVVGPIPQDGFSFALPAVDGDGYLLVGWTYYDNTAVYVGRIVRVDSSGDVLWERSISELTDDSAYSYLADGVQTDGGYVLCGMESPGIMLGGAGWVLSIATDGSLDWQRRYPATDRDLEQTPLQDVFTSIEATDDGYVLSGHYQPDQQQDSRAWLLGLEESGDVRFDDRFEVDGPTRAFDLAVSDAEDYELLLVGATGAHVGLGDRQHFHPHEPEVEGDGFIAAYTAGGDRAWLERRDGTPMFCTEHGPLGVVAGGVHRNRGWVGTVDRTDFEADRESAVVSLCSGHGDGVVGAGRLLFDDRTEGWAQSIDVADSADDSERDSQDDENDPDATDVDESSEPNDQDSDSSSDDSGDTEDTDTPAEPDDSDREGGEDGEDGLDGAENEDDTIEESVEFLDCETVRITGSIESVLFDVVWWTEDGLIGTIHEPVGGVDGDRTISASAEFGPFAYGPILESVELFDETPATPGLGDRSYRNPDSDACRNAIFDQLEADGIDPDGSDGGPGSDTDEGDETATEAETNASSQTDPDADGGSETTDEQTDESDAGDESEPATESEPESTADGDSESGSDTETIESGDSTDSGGGNGTEESETVDETAADEQ